MAVLDNKAWGKDPNCDNGSCCWVDIIDGKIADPRFAKTPEDFTYESDYNRRYLAKAKLVKVTRTVVTTLEFDNE
jgi:hypothetical protein